MKVLKTKLNYSSSYVLLDLDSIKIGEITSFDIFIKKDDNFVIIIEAGTLISESLYNKLRNQKSLYVYKDPQDKEILSCESLRYHIRLNRDNEQKRVEILYEVTNQLFDIFLTKSNFEYSSSETKIVLIS